MNGREYVSEQIVAALKKIPYAKALGIQSRFTDDEFTLVLPFSQENIGNPVLPALHGGCIGGFMETAAICQIILETAAAGFMPSDELPKPIGINIDYLRRGKPVETYARATVFKKGARVTNVRVHCWQEDYARPIAALHGHFLAARRPGA